MLPKNPTKRPKVKESTLRNRADKLAREKCLATGGCVMRGYDPLNKGLRCTDQIHWAHVKSRRFKALRHDPRNSVPLCASHHRFSHDHPDLFVHWVTVTYPGRLEALNDILRSNVKVRYADILEGLKDA